MRRVNGLTLLMIALAGCQAGAATGSTTAALIGTSKFGGHLSVLGTLPYGGSASASYTPAPTYRAFGFSGAAGDHASIKVHSGDGDAIAWLVDAGYHIVAENDDASDDTTDAAIEATLPGGGTYYVIFRELDLGDGTFTVSLAGGAQGGRQNGAACAGNAECTSGFCVDGVCCNSACNGACQACDGSGGAPAGTCGVAPAGSPKSGHGSCSGSSAVCSGVCDGVSSSCTWPATSCRAINGCSGTCSDGACVAAGARCGSQCCPCGCTVIGGASRCALCN